MSNTKIQLIDDINDITKLNKLSNEFNFFISYVKYKEDLHICSKYLKKHDLNDEYKNIYTAEIHLTISYLKKIFCNKSVMKYMNNIFMNDLIFTQVLYAFENNHYVFDLHLNMSYKLLQIYSSDFNLYTVDNLKYMELLDKLCIRSFISTYKNISITDDGIKQMTDTEWMNFLKTKIITKLFDIYTSKNDKITKKNTETRLYINELKNIIGNFNNISVCKCKFL